MAAAKRRRADALGADVEVLALASRDERRSPSQPSPARRTNPREVLAFERTSPTCGAALRPTALQGQSQGRGQDTGERLSPTRARGSAGRWASVAPGPPAARGESGRRQQLGIPSPERLSPARGSGAWAAQQSGMTRTAGGRGGYGASSSSGGGGGGTRQPAALVESPGAGGGGVSPASCRQEARRPVGSLSALPVHPLRDQHQRQQPPLPGGSGHARAVGRSCLPGAATPDTEPDAESPQRPQRPSRPPTAEGPAEGRGGDGAAEGRGGDGAGMQPLQQHMSQDEASAGSRNDSDGGVGEEELAAVIPLPLSLERISAGRRLPPVPYHLLLQPPPEGSQRPLHQELALGLHVDKGSHRSGTEELGQVPGGEVVAA